MKCSKLNKVLASMLLLSSSMIMNPSQANADWKKDSNGWWNTEGTSYSKGWRKLDGKWYYFFEDNYYDKEGYMAHDTIIDRYYLNSNGEWEKQPSSEINTYINLLKDLEWQKNNGITVRDGESTIDQNIIIDIDKDGVFEMILNHGTCSADYKVSVVTYDNGNVNIEHIDAFSGGYFGYSKSTKTFFVSGGHMGNYFKDGYTIENKKCKKVCATTDTEICSRDYNGCLVITGHDYTLDGQKISTEEYEKYFEKFGNIEK